MTEIPTNAGQMLNRLACAAHETALEHGFYADHDRVLAELRYEGLFDSCEIIERDFVLGQIAKIASECGEAVAAIQHGEPTEALIEELADIIIRTFDLAMHLSGDIGNTLVAKMETNKTRPYKHGKVC